VICNQKIREICNKALQEEMGIFRVRKASKNLNRYTIFES